MLLACAGTATAAVPAGWLGAAVGEDLPARPLLLDREFALMARSGAHTTRLTIDWNVAQPAADWPASLVATDAIVLAAARSGVTVLPTVVGAPSWASDDPPTGTYVLRPRDPAQYAAFVTTLIARYGPAGTLWTEHRDVRPRPIRAWQVWNEPNLTRYWRTNWVSGYTALLEAAHAAIKAADPGAQVVLAGLPNYSWLGLQALYRRGAGRFFDVVAVHPYTKRLTSLMDIVEANRRVMRANGDREAELWITELSWPAAKGRARDLGFNVTAAEQRRLLRAGVRELAARRRSLRIGRVLWYSWLSRGSGTTDPFAYSGLRWLTPSGGVRSTPGYDAFRDVAREIGAR
ncbi:MAG: hypothetical protein JHC95_06845 [Solirubrobacteraceae bacterium]|nr:hypothetical protein [Solirubrobacteraceae bacterium]